MAIVFLALNGDGLGHLVRTTILGQILKSVDERPIIFSQGIFPLDDRTNLPGKHVPSLWRGDEATRRRVAAEIQSMAEISLPAVLVEDTHPNPIRLPARIRRVLVVRPTSFTYLHQLNERYGSMYSAFLLCDAPDSPTWVYSKAETRQVLSWKKWNVVGPVYRVEKADTSVVRERYALNESQRLCVFSMGGGGQHPPFIDAEKFLVFVSNVAEQIQAEDPNTRLIFVKGPYFPSDIKIDGRFEVVDREPRMPALLAAADGAVIRSGFNTTWECVAAGTPFWPFIGITYGEPTDERLEKLRSWGLLAADVKTFWKNHQWRTRFRELCENAVARWPGHPDGERLSELVLGSRRQRETTAMPSLRPAKALMPSQQFYRTRLLHFRRKTPFVIRIDDVVDFDSTLSWVIQLLALRRLRASLEVVPYLIDFDDTRLDVFDPSGNLFEVSQHGYAHIPNSGQDGKRYEFLPDAACSTREEEKVLNLGMRRLQALFPKRFCGGFSPPYDGLPNWIPRQWQELGGTFVSSVFTKRVEDAPLPIIKAGIDIWNWSRNRARPLREILRAIGKQAKEEGHAGIVLHPRCLRSRSERIHLVKLLNILHLRGMESTALSALALSKNGDRRAAFDNDLKSFVRGFKRSLSLSSRDR